ncbi:MAG: helix-turn-helix transcriptional regulator [Gammaproteobacteria bacterium]|nr:helix-turn-helix transcriptional regulator [Gammaproteobacteria bacterium]
MRLQEFGFAVRQARIARGLTQAELAASAGLSRTTLNQLENGLFPELGVKKLQSLLKQVGLTLSLQPASNVRRPDPFQMACSTASVSYRNPLTVDELIRGLLTGKVPGAKRPHFRTLLDEAPLPLLRDLVIETSRWSKPGRVQKNLSRIARDIGAGRKLEEWIQSA